MAAILRELERFLLELGTDFSFIARQKRMTIGDRDFYWYSEAEINQIFDFAASRLRVIPWISREALTGGRRQMQSFTKLKGIFVAK